VEQISEMTPDAAAAVEAAAVEAVEAAQEESRPKETQVGDAAHATGPGPTVSSCGAHSLQYHYSAMIV
jgi:hypothetical protein